MTKPDVTLQPSKGVIAQAAAQIYAAHIIADQVAEEDADAWIKRSIREAVAIARTIDASVQSDDELPSTEGGEVVLQQTETQAGSLPSVKKTPAEIETSASQAAADALSMEGP